MTTAKKYLKDACRPFLLGGWLRLVVFLSVVAMLLLVVRGCLLTQVSVAVHRNDLGLLAGDRVLVSRVSYGLKLPTERWWGHSRLGKSHPQKGDLVVYEIPEHQGRMCLDRVSALPGDTLWLSDDALTFVIVPQGTVGVSSFILPEEYIVGRPLCISYSVDRTQPFCRLLRPERLFVKIR